LKIAADREQCIGSGNCVLVAPDVFDQDDEEALVVLRTSTPPEELRGKVNQAIGGCPVRALSLAGD
jgi:ferredoxin